VEAGDVRRLSRDGWAELKQAVHDHQVVLLRHQDLDDDALYEVASHLGTPMDLGHGGLIGALHHVSTFAITPEKPPIADKWHTDLTYLKAPPAFGILYNVVAPPVGGDTMWSSSYAVFDALSPPIQRLCSELKALHTPGPGIYEHI
jgi:taurine dioxygenase